MASIRVNGVKHQSGSGAHPTKDNLGRKRTRAAKKDEAIREAIGEPFRFGNRGNSKDFSEKE